MHDKCPLLSENLEEKDEACLMKSWYTRIIKQNRTNTRTSGTFLVFYQFHLELFSGPS